MKTISLWLISFILATVLLSLLLWGAEWAVQHPFNKYGVITIYSQLIDFSRPFGLTNKVSQATLLIAIVWIHGYLTICWAGTIEEIRDYFIRRRRNVKVTESK